MGAVWARLRAALPAHWESDLLAQLAPCGGCCGVEAEADEGCVSIRRWRSAGLRLLNQASKAALSGVPSAEEAAGCVCSAG